MQAQRGRASDLACPLQEHDLGHGGKENDWTMNFKASLFGGTTLESTAANAGLLILRALTGVMLAFGHGLGKLPPAERFTTGVSELGFPLPGVFAWAAGLSEFVGGLCLALGLATKPAACFIFITMLVAGIMRHADDPFATKEKAFLYAIIALVFMLIGSGKFGLDALIRRPRS
jgi:putative oxidoreductase